MRRTTYRARLDPPAAPPSSQHGLDSKDTLWMDGGGEATIDEVIQSTRPDQTCHVSFALSSVGPSTPLSLSYLCRRRRGLQQRQKQGQQQEPAVASSPPSWWTCHRPVWRNRLLL